MALTASTIVEVETGGNDTNNGGMFDPSQTAGMFTDGAATSATGNAPVFTSASYTFIAGDVGAYLFIGAGTNWLRGWYKIASVAAGAVTLNATIRQAIAYNTATISRFSLSAVAGVASVASPTSATWSIDYSQQAAVQFAYTDLASVGAGLTVSSVLKPFAKQQVGNAIVVTSGTNFTIGRYVIASVAAGVATVIGPGNITTGAGVSGVGGQGGALATPGLASGLMTIAGMGMFWKSGAYSITSTTANISGGRVALQQNNQWLVGYDTYRMDMSDTQPVLTLATTFTILFLAQNTGHYVANFTLDGSSVTFTLAAGISASIGYRVNVKNCPSNGIQTDRTALFNCSALNCAIGFPSGGDNSFIVNCVAKSCSSSGFGGGNNNNYVNCITQACGSGFGGGTRCGYYGCVAYGSTVANGWQLGNYSTLMNCVAEGNATNGFDLNSATDCQLINCAVYNNTLANVNNGTAAFVMGLITGTSSFFTAAASGDFSLSTTSGGGALLKGTGMPQTFPLGFTVATPNIGAVQASVGSGGGGGASNFAFC